MLIDVTVNMAPRPPIPDMSPDGEAVDGLDALDDEDDGDDAELDAPAPERRPITVTWWPTCSSSLTPASAINLSSRPPPDARLVLAVVLDAAGAGLPGVGLPAWALSLLGLLDALELVLASLPNLKFFSTKPPLPGLLVLAPLDGLALDDVSLDAPPARCRQPVALALEALALVDDCGVDVVGLCAASVPHSATAVLSVTAHCPWCVFFMTSPPVGPAVQGTIHGLFLADIHAGRPARAGSGPGGRRWQPQ
jgi:hypothetical protein